MHCNFCGDPAHPATGCVYGPNTIACYSCVQDFWTWVRAHTNSKGKRPRSEKPVPSVSFYEAAGRVISS